MTTPERENMEQRGGGWDDRVVEYEKIHKIKDEYFRELIDAVDPKSGEVILDGMDGYGSVAKWILKRIEKKAWKNQKSLL